MNVLNPTSPDKLVDAEGRPYFLWDVDLTLDGFRRMLADGDAETRAYLVGKLMRQAKPDDVFSFVTVGEIRALWPELERYLGRTREFWAWLLAELGENATVIELVEDPSPGIDDPHGFTLDTNVIHVDSTHEILVNKLCALLSRSELRDFTDILALIEDGADLKRALVDAPRKDGGFSPLTLMWIVKQMPLAAMASASGVSTLESESLLSLRNTFLERVARLAEPDS